jgi:5-methyltetrahydrofolate--homocysteine methyltransferase
VTHLLDALSERVLLCDGGTGTSVHTYNLDVEDYWGHENCTEILVRSRPDIVRAVQRAFYAAGADIVETNTFGGSPITLGEFGLGNEAYGINKEATELLREVAEEFAGDERERWVIGDVGPGTKLASLGHIDYDTLEDGYAVQCAGLIDGGVHGILLLTFQDPLQLKAAANGAKRAREAAKSNIPIFGQVTLETTGTMLVGTDIAAAATVVRALDIPLVGMNCATGPEHMAAHVRWLGRNWPGLIAVQPNGGLPELVDGKVCYPLSPAVLASWLERFLEEHAVNLLGGCCGTGPAHIAALDAMLRRRAARGSHRPLPSKRQNYWVPALASLYRQAPLRRNDRAFLIGCGCDAALSPEFDRYQAAADWEACLAVARVDEASGADAITLSVGSQEREQTVLAELASRMRGALSVPLMIRSTDSRAIAAVLKLYGGKALVDPQGPIGSSPDSEQVVGIARRFGAAVLHRVCLDGTGPAAIETALHQARAGREFACDRRGLAPEDLLLGIEIPCLKAKLDESTRPALDLVVRLAAEIPDCPLLVDVSRLTEGVPKIPAIVLTHVVIELARERGAVATIVDVSRFGAKQQVPDGLRQAATAMLLAERGLARLEDFVACCNDRTLESEEAPAPMADVGARLSKRIVDGNRKDMEADLNEALKERAPLEIITEFLLAGMKTVGDLFGEGRIPLPHVLESAETMKAAVGYLQSKMDRVEAHSRGTIVLATVKGDIHDIGKNLVDIVLTNSGFRTVNLGNKQPIEAILKAAHEERADAIGMSGLLLNSAIVMRTNLAEMARRKLSIPVLLGGAALSRRFVAENCAPAYAGGQVAYAGDVFDGLRLMQAVVKEEFASVATKAETDTDVGESSSEPAPELRDASERPLEGEELGALRADLHERVNTPLPPFYGARTLELNVDALVPLLNRRTLYMFHWGYKKAGRSLEQWRAWSEEKLRPIMEDLLDRCRRERILIPRAVYGYWKCAAAANSLVLFEQDGTTEAARFNFPRQRRPGGICIADFFRPLNGTQRDLIGLQIVTMGQRASDMAREWYRADRYRDYLFLHGLGVELTEAAAEYVHKKIRNELGMGADDAHDVEALLRHGYRGSRYSFGYPACPNMEDQRVVLRLLDAQRIGVTMADNVQLHPELSTCAIIAHHPQAGYFGM